MVREQIIDAVRDWLDNDDWRYKYDAEHYVIDTGIELDSKLKSGRVLIFFAEDCYTVYVIAPISGDKNDLGELNKYLTMANYGLRNGNFELDVTDGEIRYKTYVNCMGLDTLPEKIIEHSICAGWYTMDRYGNGIAALALGFSDAETEIQKAEQPDEENESEA